MEARNERRVRALQKHLNTVKLLIVDELGYVPFTAVGSELLFEVFSQRYERGATLVDTPTGRVDPEQTFVGPSRSPPAQRDDFDQAASKGRTKSQLEAGAGFPNR
jgi:hypothetical protein